MKELRGGICPVDKKEEKKKKREKTEIMMMIIIIMMIHLVFKISLLHLSSFSNF